MKLELRENLKINKSPEDQIKTTNIQRITAFNVPESPIAKQSHITAKEARLKIRSQLSQHLTDMQGNSPVQKSSLHEEPKVAKRKMDESFVQIDKHKFSNMTNKYYSKKQSPIKK